MRRSLLSVAALATSVVSAASSAGAQIDPRCPSTAIRDSVLIAAERLSGAGDDKSGAPQSVEAATFSAAQQLLSQGDGTGVLGLVHPDWKGVVSSHYRVPQFNGHTLELRSFTDVDAMRGLLAAISQAPEGGLHTIVVDGVLDGTVGFASHLACVRPDVEVLAVIHSGPSSPDHFAESPHIAAVINAAKPAGGAVSVVQLPFSVDGSKRLKTSALKQVRTRADAAAAASTDTTTASSSSSSASKPLIARVGVVKAGFAPFLSAMGVSVHTLVNYPPSEEEVAASASALTSGAPLDLPPSFTSRFGSDLTSAREDGITHIGVLGSGKHKNLAAQVLAACFVPSAVVHVTEDPGTAYLSACTAPVIVHGSLPASQFRALLSVMDVNLYVSLSECFPAVPLESAAAGVPCLISPTSDVYGSDAALTSALVVDQPDNPEAIRDRLLDVLATMQGSTRAAAEMRDRLQTRLLPSVRSKAQRSWGAFLSGAAPADVSSKASTAAGVADVISEQLSTLTSRLSALFGVPGSSASSTSGASGKRASNNNKAPSSSSAGQDGSAIDRYMRLLQASNSATASGSATPSYSFSFTPSATPTGSASATASYSYSCTVTPTSTSSPSSSASASASTTPTGTGTPLETATPSSSPAPQSVFTKTEVIAGIAVGASVAFLGALATTIFICRRRSGTSYESKSLDDDGAGDGKRQKLLPPVERMNPASPQNPDSPLRNSGGGGNGNFNTPGTPGGAGLANAQGWGAFNVKREASLTWTAQQTMGAIAADAGARPTSANRNQFQPSPTQAVPASSAYAGGAGAGPRRQVSKTAVQRDDSSMALDWK